jgi:serine/threonine protein kinase
MSIHHYEKEEKLGEGTYGIVYKAIDKRTGESVALKCIRVDHEEQGIPATSIREISVLKELHHPNIVDLREVINAPGKLTLVFEYLDTDLRNYLEHAQTPVQPLMLKSYAYQVLCGLAYCHCHRILHRDIKPSNLLLNKSGSIKLCDFGLARTFGLPFRTYTHEIVTLWYRPPEVLLGDKTTKYTTAVDIWSTGCILAEMALRKVLFKGDSEIDQLYRMFRILGTPTENSYPGVSEMPGFSDVFPNWKSQEMSAILPEAEPQLLDLLGQMLVYDPAKRITAKAALNHPYFDEIPVGIKQKCRPCELNPFSR